MRFALRGTLLTEEGAVLKPITDAAWREEPQVVVPKANFCVLGSLGCRKRLLDFADAVSSRLLHADLAACAGGGLVGTVGLAEIVGGGELTIRISADD